MKSAFSRNSDERLSVKGALVLFLFSTLAVVLGIVVLNSLAIPFIQAYKSAMLSLVFITILLLFLSGLIFWRKQNEVLYKMILSVLILLIFFLFLLLIAEVTDFITILQSQTLYEAFLKRAGAYMPYIFIFVQIFQVLFLPFPAIFSMAVGVKLFGVFLSSVYSFIGIFIGSVLAFLIGRKLGCRAVEWLIGRETLYKWKERLKGKDHLILTAMLLLPFFPDDILCFIAGISTMSTGYFLIMITCARAISCFFSCYSIEVIPLHNWWGILTWSLIFISMIILFVVLGKNIDKINSYLQKKRKNR